MKKKVALGMSGGVDSSLSAHLLVKQGYDVTGVYLECWRAPGCRTEEDRQDALKVALSLDIPFQVLDFKQAYKDKVVEYFFEEYQQGKTPNPDVICNKEIKFGLFYDWAMDQGFDSVATGHYAGIAKTSDGHQLVIPTDADKDQTYFLYPLTEHQLVHTMFPLHNYTKKEVRAEAIKHQIHVANKKDSVGICFIGDIDVRAFLRDRLGENPGEVVDVDGNVIGKHKGLWFYTIGQRHGFEIDKRTLIKQSDGTTIAKQNVPPFYVIAKDAEQNRLVVGFGKDTYAGQFEVEDVHWINPKSYLDLENLNNLRVRIRHTGQLLPCQVKRVDKTTLLVTLEQPIQGIAEGQSAVFYQQQDANTVCLGGGVININQ